MRCGFITLTYIFTIRVMPCGKKCVTYNLFIFRLPMGVHYAPLIECLAVWSSYASRFRCFRMKLLDPWEFAHHKYLMFANVPAKYHVIIIKRK